MFGSEDHAGLDNVVDRIETDFGEGGVDRPDLGGHGGDDLGGDAGDDLGGDAGDGGDGGDGGAGCSGGGDGGGNGGGDDGGQGGGGGVGGGVGGGGAHADGDGVGEGGDHEAEVGGEKGEGGDAGDGGDGGDAGDGGDGGDGGGGGDKVANAEERREEDQHGAEQSQAGAALDSFFSFPEFTPLFNRIEGFVNNPKGKSPLGPAGKIPMRDPLGRWQWVRGPNTGTLITRERAEQLLQIAHFDRKMIQRYFISEPAIHGESSELQSKLGKSLVSEHGSFLDSDSDADELCSVTRPV